MTCSGGFRSADWLPTCFHVLFCQMLIRSHKNVGHFTTITRILIADLNLSKSAHCTQMLRASFSFSSWLMGSLKKLESPTVLMAK